MKAGRIGKKLFEIVSIFVTFILLFSFMNVSRTGGSQDRGVRSSFFTQSRRK